MYTAYWKNISDALNTQGLIRKQKRLWRLCTVACTNEPFRQTWMSRYASNNQWNDSAIHKSAITLRTPTFSVANESFNTGVKFLELHIKCFHLLLFILKPLQSVCMQQSTAKSVIMAALNFGSLVYQITLAPLILAFLLAELRNTLK